MATELAKAYVQIMPSAQGIRGMITEALGGEAANAGTTAGESFGKKLTGAIKGIIVAAGIGKILSDTISEGAALEQSIGGIETLFKENADLAKKYADEAYRTAGLSANDYMETVTGFSASLLQGLGGDTEKAANVANMAVIDMSDNANKMGTSMESIQNAYQGFAKQNYTMLDNLKLGYGGTKEEMKRLLDDAEKISGIKYDMSNLGDVYEAIHVIQGELGITGTTAEEAASTLSGSMASMKAAFKNTLGNLALGEDIGPSLQALGETVFTFLTGNLIPMVGNILKGVPTILHEMLYEMSQAGYYAEENANKIVQSGMDIIRQFGTVIVGQAPFIVESAIRLITAFGTAILNADWIGIATSMIDRFKYSINQIAEETFGSNTGIVDAVGLSITENLPGLLEKGIEIITNLETGILQSIPLIIDAAGSLLSELVAFVMENLPTIVKAGVELAGKLAQGLIDNLPAIISSIGRVLGQLLSTIEKYFPQLLQSGIKLIGELAQGLINNIPMIVASIGRVIGQLLSTIGTYLPQMVQTGIKLIGQLAVGLIQAIPNVVRSVPQIISSIKEAFGQFDWKSIGSNIIKGIGDGITAGVGAIEDAAKNAAKAALDAAKNLLGIHSPSTVMRDQVGYQIPAGIAVGIQKNTSPIIRAMQKLVQETTGTLQTDLEVGIRRSGRSLEEHGSSLSGSDKNQGGFVQNLTIISKKELSPYETQRLTRNANREMVLALRGV